MDGPACVCGCGFECLPRLGDGWVWARFEVSLLLTNASVSKGVGTVHAHEIVKLRRGTNLFEVRMGGCVRLEIVCGSSEW